MNTLSQRWEAKKVEGLKHHIKRKDASFSSRDVLLLSRTSCPEGQLFSYYQSLRIGDLLQQLQLVTLASQLQQELPNKDQQHLRSARKNILFFLCAELQLLSYICFLGLATELQSCNRQSFPQLHTRPANTYTLLCLAQVSGLAFTLSRYVILSCTGRKYFLLFLNVGAIYGGNAIFQRVSC